jgi:replicative DNA helicase
MRAQHLIARELATEAGVEHWKMRRPERITPEETASLVEAASHECQSCRFLDGELSIVRIRRVARQMKAGAGLDLVIVDCDELVEAPRKDEFDQQRYIVCAGKSLAIELENRDGKVGAIDARFNVKTLRFESLPKSVPEQPDWVNR